LVVNCYNYALCSSSVYLSRPMGKQIPFICHEANLQQYKSGLPIWHLWSSFNLSSNRWVNKRVKFILWTEDQMQIFQWTSHSI